MKIASISLALILSLGGATASAKGTASKQETIGVGSGATIGAIAGDPVGLILGAAIGAAIGDGYHRKDVETEQLSGALDRSRILAVELERDLEAMGEDIDELGSELLRSQTLARPELLDLMQAGIEMDLLFRTDEHVLSETTSERLASLAFSLAAMPDVYVQLDGFADERGQAAYNEELSQRRVEYVRNVLAANGVPASRVQATAYGEAKAADETADSYALERRVSLKLFIDPTLTVASNPR